MTFLCMTLHCKLVPVQYREYKYGLFQRFVFLPSLLQHYKYRKSFKEVLHQERVLDEARKREAMHATRLNRLQKQVLILTTYLILIKILKIYFQAGVFTESGAYRPAWFTIVTFNNITTLMTLNNLANVV